MTSLDSTSPENETEVDKKQLLVTSLQDLTIIEAWDSKITETPKYITFYLVTDDEEVFFGQSSRNKRDMTLADYNSALQRVQDEEIYPEIPADAHLAIAPEILDDSSAYVKRPGLDCYETMKGSNYIPRAVLSEALIMEQISRSPHLNIIHYYGCRVRRGRITAIILERLEQTLTQYASTPGFQQLDKVKFFEALKSAVDHLHSLGLAHNDINPHNIMVKNGMPVLIDFGSCQPFGKHLQSLGTEGWYEKEFYTSEKQHDTYSLEKLREWL